MAKKWSAHRDRHMCNTQIETHTHTHIEMKMTWKKSKVEAQRQREGERYREKIVVHTKENCTENWRYQQKQLAEQNGTEQTERAKKQQQEQRASSDNGKNMLTKVYKT